jgi:hypothetical protein
MIAQGYLVAFRGVSSTLAIFGKAMGTHEVIQEKPSALRCESNENPVFRRLLRCYRQPQRPLYLGNGIGEGETVPWHTEDVVGGELGIGHEVGHPLRRQDPVAPASQDRSGHQDQDMLRSAIPKVMIVPVNVALEMISLRLC